VGSWDFLTLHLSTVEETPVCSLINSYNDELKTVLNQFPSGATARSHADDEIYVDTVKLLSNKEFKLQFGDGALPACTTVELVKYCI